MGCPSASRIADLRRGRLDEGAGAEVEAHLAGCASCRTVELRVGGALDALRSIAEQPAPVASSAARVEAALRWTLKTRRYAAPRPWAWGFALSAAAAGVALIALHPWRRQAAPETMTAPPVVAAPSVVAPREQPLEALVTLLGGEATVGSGASRLALDGSAHLRAGDVVTTATAGRVGLQWGEGSGALLHGQSELALARLDPRAQDLALHRGGISVRVGPHQPGESLRVVTPDHTVVVHGTWFEVACDARGTTVEVLEGVVEVSANAGDGSSTRVAAPQRAFFARGTGTGVAARALSGKEAAALRLGGEMGLQPWSSLEKIDASTAFLRVSSEPPAQLVVDGVAFGSTPLALRRTRGRHLIELSRPGFATLSRWVQVGDETGELHLALLSANSRETPPASDEVQGLLKLRKQKISACYERSLKRDPTLAGTVTLAIRIGGAGQVLGTRVDDDTLPAPEVAECLRREAAGWSFPSARNATVVYPFVFRAP